MIAKTRQIAADQNMSRSRKNYAWISNSTYLVPGEEAEFVKRAAAGDYHAMDSLVRAYSKFAYSLAKVYLRRLPHDCLDDLLSESFLAIMDAVSCYDPEAGKLMSYIGIHIKRRLALWCSREQLPVYVPSNEVWKVLKRSRYHTVTNLDSSEPDKDVQPGPVVIPLSLDDPAHRESVDDHELCLSESDYVAGIVTDGDGDRIIALLDSILSAFPQRNADIYKMYYGIPHGEKLRLADVAKKYNLSGQAVSLIVNGINIKIMKDARCRKQALELKAYVTSDWKYLQ